VQTKTIIRDSTVVREVIRKDTIHIAGDTVRITELIECDSITKKPKPFKAIVKSGRAKATVVIDNRGKLTVEASCDSLQKLIDVMDREIFRLRHEQTETTITKSKSGFMAWIDNTCRFLAIVFILFIIFKIAKRFIWPT